MEKEDLEKWFENNTDCYADTREECFDTEPPTMIDGEVVTAMTKDKFVEVVGKIVLGLHLEFAESQIKERQLPTDEEIEKWVNEHGYYGSCTSEYHEGLDRGAKWMRNKKN